MRVRGLLSDLLGLQGLAVEGIIAKRNYEVAEVIPHPFGLSRFSRCRAVT